MLQATNARKRKAEVNWKVVTIILIITTFFITSVALAQVKNKADTKTKESLCRASLVAKENTRIDAGVKNIEVISEACITQEVKVPVEKKALTKDAFMKQFSEYIPRCWKETTEGVIGDPLTSTNWFFDKDSNRCFTCFIVETGKFDFGVQGNKISAGELEHFLQTTPYIIDTNIPASEAKNAKTSCEKGGGTCVDNNVDSCKGGSLVEPSSGLSCGTSSSKRCCVKSSKYWAYIPYIQSYSGEGVFEMSVKEILPEKRYAITFIDYQNRPNAIRLSLLDSSVNNCVRLR